MSTTAKNNIGIFLDRDGTINVEIFFLKNPDDLSLIPDAAKAIREMNEMGLKVFVITNQSGIARGYLTEDDLHLVHKKLTELLQKENAFLDAMYYCKHFFEESAPAEEKCTCRKPNIGMLQQAEKEFGIDLKKSFVVGDRFVDVNAGKNAGATSILVRTGYGEEALQWAIENNVSVDYVAKNLYDAWQRIKELLLKNNE
ncbi:MAG: HAD family hydrolase [Bacteroidota bacterium]